MNHKRHLLNLILPAVFFGGLTGFFTAVVILFYKLCAHYVIDFSETGYAFVKDRLYLVPAVIITLGIFAFILSKVYKNAPNLRGGGIPTSINVLRGIITFKWFRNLAGIFVLSLSSFLIGVPLGNEGPSVQMGTAIGSGTMHIFPKKYTAWKRYAMTGGACAGFSVATGAPISGILFAVEEAHQRISPTIISFASVSVLTANVSAELLAPFFNVSISLFPESEVIRLSAEHLILAAIIGVTMGLFAVLFLNYYGVINALSNKLLRKVPHWVKIFGVFVLTFAAGLVSSSCVSTGHELILSLTEKSAPIYVLLIILVVRASLTLLANTNKITGGIFIPILTIGALVSSMLARGLESAFSISSDFYAVILALGMAACIASLMKMPITAIAFGVEALGCGDNILHLVVVCVVSYVITELFGVKSINDKVVEDRIAEYSRVHPPKLIDTKIKIEKGAFAVGKEIRDIFWPTGLFVLSTTHDESSSHRHEEELRAGDTLHVRYTTCDEEKSKQELDAITKNY